MYWPRRRPSLFGWALPVSSNSALSSALLLTSTEITWLWLVSRLAVCLLSFFVCPSFSLLCGFWVLFLSERCPPDWLCKPSMTIEAPGYHSVETTSVSAKSRLRLRLVPFDSWDRKERCAGSQSPTKALPLCAANANERPAAFVKFDKFCEFANDSKNSIPHEYDEFVLSNCFQRDR